MEKLKYKIHKQDSDISINDYFIKFHVGQKQIYKLFLSDSVFINGKNANKNDLLKENDLLEILIDEDIDFKISKQGIDVVYEDENILIVNKPVGIIIHPDGNESDDTLVNRVAKYYYDKGIKRKIRYIHRIDLETSGIVVFAKDFLTYALLSYQIEKHLIKREYLALVENKFKEKEGRINKSIGRDRHVSNKYRVSNSINSKEAITNYYVIKNYDDYAYIRLVLETGRTHQIRVHMSSLNHPLLGDTLYGGRKKLISRVALHSFRVTLIQPFTKEKLIVEVNEPNDMLKLIK